MAEAGIDQAGIRSAIAARTCRIRLGTAVTVLSFLSTLLAAFAMLLAMRRAPIAVESDRGFQVIAEAEEQHEIVAAHARAA